MRGERVIYFGAVHSAGVSVLLWTVLHQCMYGKLMGFNGLIFKKDLKLEGKHIEVDLKGAGR